MTALPSVAEKGYIDVRLTVSSPGGHSSIPPNHTVEFFTPDSLAVILTPHDTLFHPEYWSLGNDDYGTGRKPDPSQVVERSGSLTLVYAPTLTRRGQITYTMIPWFAWPPTRRTLRKSFARLSWTQQPRIKL